MLTGLDLNWSNLTSEFHLTPLVAYPIALIYNIPTLPINQPLLTLTPEILVQLITNDSIVWNDPSIVDLNPGLASNFLRPRFIFSSVQSPINQLIIDYLFENETQRNGTWGDLVVPISNVPIAGYNAIVSAIGITTNSWSFLPLPLVKTITNTNVKIASLILNSTVNAYSTPSFTFTNVDSNKLNVETERTGDEWPLNTIVFLGYDTQGSNCSFTKEVARFSYWTLNGTLLQNNTQDFGFYFFDEESRHVIQDHLLNATCNSERMLVYDNLSTKIRSIVVFTVVTFLVLVLAALNVFTWTLRENSKTAPVIILHSSTSFGLLFMAAANTLWWFSPVTDAVCHGRIWTQGLSYSLVISTAFIYIYSIDSMIKNKTDLTKMMPKNWKIALVFTSLQICEIVILLVWSLLENMKSTEIVVDAIQWTSRTTCTSVYGYMDIFQSIFFAGICIWGCVVIYRHWKEGTRSDDTRWIMMSLNNVILIWILFLVISRILELTDDQYYIIDILFYSLAEASIVISFFLPRLARIVKSKTSGTKRSDSAELKTATEMPTMS